MRLLHTSDWHLGKRLHGVELLVHQAEFIDWLVDVVRSEGVDAVIVAGDLYDRSNPAVDAIEVFDDAVLRLAGTGVPLLMISGNHDSPTRVGTHARLLRSLDVHVASDPAHVGTPVILNDDHGDIAIYSLPYLDPGLTRETLDAPLARHTEVVGAAMARVQTDLAQRPGTRSVVIAHAFVAGGSVSDSERDLTIGGADSIPVSLFNGIHYTALGHLHGPQTMAGNVRYSGSPLAYSFSEESHAKSVSIVDLADNGTVAVTEIPVPVPRRLVTIEGTLDDLLASPDLADAEDTWVRALLTDTILPTGPMDRLRARFPHTLTLEHRPTVDHEAPRDDRGTRLRGLDTLSTVVAFYREQVGEDPSDEELTVLSTAVDATRQVEVRDA